MRVQAIIEASAAVHGIAADDLVGKSRKKRLTQARQTAAFLLDDMGLTFTEIAKNLNRSHNTAASALIDSIEINMTPERQAQVDAARIVATIRSAEMEG